MPTIQNSKPEARKQQHTIKKKKIIYIFAKIREYSSLKTNRNNQHSNTYRYAILQKLRSRSKRECRYMYKVRRMDQREAKRREQEQSGMARGTFIVFLSRKPWNTPLLCRKNSNRRTTASHTRRMRHLDAYRLYHNSCRQLYRCQRQPDQEQPLSS